MVVTVDELVKARDENALKATSAYNNKYVKLTGKLSTVDSNGKYFSLDPLSGDSNNMNFTKEQEVTVIGTITSVGEGVPYTVNVESIK